MIKPTIGRVVWFQPPKKAEEPLLTQAFAALICFVHSDTLVNVAFFDQNGKAGTATSVRLVQEGEDVPANGYFAEWMPYQVGQAKKQESEVAASSAQHPVEQLAADVGGTITSMMVRPDGSGNATMSMPLPADHWLTRPGYDEPPMGFRKGTDDPDRAEWAEKIRAAARYAVRGATMNGADDDFDPDALVQNMVVGMLGYFTPDGLSHVSDLAIPAA